MSFVSDLKTNSSVTAYYMVAKKDLRQGKRGKYLTVVLQDKTGSIDAKVWDNAEALGKLFDEGDVVNISGDVTTYNGSLQLTVKKLEKLDSGDFEPAYFLPSSIRDSEDMFSELTAIIDSLDDEDIKALLREFFKDDDIRERFKTAPAAMKMHHDYIGGLIEHILSLCAISKLVCSHYKSVNYSMIIAGCVLHDIGKIYELTYDSAFNYSDAGKLLGHITMEIEIVEEKSRLIKDFPNNKLLQIKHMLLSHHGKYEFGSPKLPMTLEALVFSKLDDLDAKVFQIDRAIKESLNEHGWTDKVYAIENTAFFAPEKVESNTENKATATKETSEVKKENTKENTKTKASDSKSDEEPSLF